MLGLNTAPMLVTLVEPTPTLEGMEGVDYPNALGHYNHEYSTATPMSKAEANLLLITDAQRHAIRAYYQGQVPQEVALRFDFRRQDGFTRATARAFIQQLPDGKEAAA